MTDMSFSEAIQTSFARYATFSGRARRAEYWWFSVLFVGVEAVVIALVVVTDIPLLGLLMLPVIAPMLATSVRRLHDTGRSGLAMLIALIPIVGPVIYLYRMTLDGNPEANQYGPSPKLPSQSTA